MAEPQRPRRPATGPSVHYYWWPCYVCGYAKPLHVYGHLSMCHWCWVRLDCGRQEIDR